MHVFPQPLNELFHDPTDANNVLVNCSFERADGDAPLGWAVLAGSATVVERPGDGHALLLNGRVRSNRFEMSARTPYEWTGEAKGKVTGVVHIIEEDRYLRGETFSHESADWAPFCWRFLPPPNAERAECELVAEGALVDNLYLDGLGAQDYDILDSQAGYHPASEKRIIIRSRTPVEGAIRWELFDTLRGRNYAEGALEPTGRDMWARWTWVADFTSLRREGYYLLRVHMPDRIVESAPIRIWNGVYEHLAYTVAKYSYLQRCGVEIPGYHKPCHTNDALWRSVAQDETYGKVLEYRDLRGGWHDAGDYNKWFHYFGYVLETLALMHKRVDLPKQTYGGDIPDVLSEIFWGADFFLKVQNPDGSFVGPIHAWYTHVRPETGERYNSNWAIFWGEKIEEDSGHGEVMHPRSRFYDYTSHNNGGLVLDLATALATAARCARGVDDPRRWTYANAALRSGAHVEKTYPGMAGHPYWVTFWYDLYRATDRPEYRENAYALVDPLLAQQAEDGSFGRPAGLKHTFHPITVLMELLVDEPAHPAREKILRAVERKLAWMEPYTLGRPWDLALQCASGGERGELSGGTMGRNAWVGNAAYVYALAGRLTGRREWLHKAEAQLAWLLGRNPHGVSQVVDAGRVNVGRYHGWSNHCENDQQGRLTGGIINGILTTDDAYPDSRNWTIMPPRFPVLSVRREDVPYAEHAIHNARHDTNEYWSLHHAGFQQAVSALAAAYKGLEEPERPRLAYLYRNFWSYDAATACDELFDRAGWNADRIASDSRYGHFDTSAYRAMVVSRSWTGSEFIDAEPFGIQMRHSFLCGVPWIFLPPEDPVCLDWLEEFSSGQVPCGEVGKPEGTWEPCRYGRVRTMHGAKVYLVNDEAALERLLVDLRTV